MTAARPGQILQLRSEVVTPDGEAACYPGYGGLRPGDTGILRIGKHGIPDPLHLEARPPPSSAATPKPVLRERLP